jgi:hypothetical protein
MATPAVSLGVIFQTAATDAAPAAQDTTTWGTRIVNALSQFRDFLGSVASKIYEAILPFLNKISDMFGKDKQVALPAMAFGAAVVTLLVLFNKYCCSATKP